MDNQHRKINGYRDLSQAEIDAINALKAQAEQTGKLLEAVKDIPGIDQRALSIARTELQTGFMWAVRSVAKPESF